MRPSGPPGRRVLVTGASGFIGRALVRELLGWGFAVRAASRTGRSSGRPAAGVAATVGQAAIEEVDLPDFGVTEPKPADWARLLDGVDCVIHLAGIAHATRRIPEATYMRVNGHAVDALGEAARRAGVRRVVLMSSVRAQTGPIAAEIVVEDSPASPTDAYGRSKLRGEIGIAGALGGGDTDYVILRPVLVYGPGVAGNMGMLARLARTRLPLPFGALRGERSLIAIDTLCQACHHALDAPGVARQTLLIADPGPALTVRQMLLAMRAGFGRRPALMPVPTGWLRAPARLAGKADAIDRMDGSLVVDTSRMHATGWRPTVPTATGLYVWAEHTARPRNASATVR